MTDDGVGNKFEMLVTDSGYIEKINNITKEVVNIKILPSTSEISHHHKVTNITMTPTSLSPFMFKRGTFSEHFKFKEGQVLRYIQFIHLMRAKMVSKMKFEIRHAVTLEKFEC